MTISRMLNVVAFVPDGRILMRRNTSHRCGWPMQRRNGLPWEATFSKTSYAKDEAALLDDANKEFRYHFRVAAGDVGTLTFIDDFAYTTNRILTIITLHMNKGNFVHLTCHSNDDISTIGIENLIMETNLTPSRFTYQTCKAIDVIKNAWRLGD